MAAPQSLCACNPVWSAQVSTRLLIRYANTRSVTSFLAPPHHHGTTNVCTRADQHQTRSTVPHTWGTTFPLRRSTTAFPRCISAHPR